MLAELHTAVLCRLCLQKVSFPRTFEASTSQHEEYMAYLARRHETAKRLQPQQDKDERGIVLQNLKNDQVAKANYRFPEKRHGLLKVQITIAKCGQIILQQADYTIAERLEKLYNITTILNNILDGFRDTWTSY